MNNNHTSKNIQKPKRGEFVAWAAYQRRTVTVAEQLELDVRFYHYSWEENAKILKPISYIFKFIRTLSSWFAKRPKLVVVQLPPTPLLYAAAIYCKLTGAKYITDNHMAMLIQDSHWIKWPMARYLITKSANILVHNKEMLNHTDILNIQPFVLRDPPPAIVVDESVEEIAGVHIKDTSYIIIPCSFGEDEPIEELLEAIRMTPDTLFFSTWFYEKLPQSIKENAPKNLIFTGFLKEKEFSALFAHANGAIVLTTWTDVQPSGAQEAISLSVPLIISDAPSTRRLYQQGAIFVSNEAKSIAEGVQEALTKHDQYSQKIGKLKEAFHQKISLQINELKASFG